MEVATLQTRTNLIYYAALAGMHVAVIYSFLMYRQMYFLFIKKINNNNNNREIHYFSKHGFYAPLVQKAGVPTSRRGELNYNVTEHTNIKQFDCERGRTNQTIHNIIDST